MTALTTGDIAPDFTLTDKDGKPHTLSNELLHAPSRLGVVYFYPKDSTPGCTIEAKEFSEILETVLAEGAVVFGISGGSDKTKASFCTKHNLTVPLLTDPTFETAKAYGSYGEKRFMGRAFQGISRKTFIVDADRRVLRAFDSVKAKGHAKAILAEIRAIKAG